VNKEDVCDHVIELMSYLYENKLRIWGELTDEPPGWVNVNCGTC